MGMLGFNQQQNHNKVRPVLLSRFPKKSIVFRWALLLVGVAILAFAITAFVNAAPQNIESESGTLSGASSIVSDTSSSNGQAVEFGTSPLPTGGRSCPPVPAYPDANCTGVLPAIARTNSTTTTVDQDGTVLENINISGRLTINASNVTIKNIKLTTNDYYGLLIYGQNVTVTDSTFISTSPDTQSVIAALGTGSYSALRVDISGGPDGIKLGDNTSLTDSYIHDLGAFAGAHNDTVNADGVTNASIIHNRLLNQLDQTSVLTLDGSGILVKDNWLAGGGYTIYGGAPKSPGNGIVVTNNVFSRQFFPNVGNWGPIAYWQSVSGNSWTNNTYDDGTPVSN